MSNWSDDEDRIIVRMLGKGMSAGRISARLTGRSRNAVLGRIHRLERKNPAFRIARSHTPNRADLRRPSVKKQMMLDAKAIRKANETQTRETQVSAKPAWKNMAHDSFTPQPDLVIPEDQRQRLLILGEDGRLRANDQFTADCCRWPIGDPVHPDFHFCARTKVGGLSYCEFHARRAFPSIKFDELQFATRPPASKTPLTLVRDKETV